MNFFGCANGFRLIAGWS